MRQPLVAPTSMYSIKRSVTRAAEVTCHGQDLVVVGAALDHHIHLEAAQACSLSRCYAGQHVGDGKSTSFMRRKTASSRPSRLTVTRFSPAF